MSFDISGIRKIRCTKGAFVQLVKLPLRSRLRLPLPCRKVTHHFFNRHDVAASACDGCAILHSSLFTLHLITFFPSWIYIPRAGKVSYTSWRQKSWSLITEIFGHGVSCKILKWLSLVTMYSASAATAQSTNLLSSKSSLISSKWINAS